MMVMEYLNGSFIYAKRVESESAERRRNKNNHLLFDFPCLFFIFSLTVHK